MNLIQLKDIIDKAVADGKGEFSIGIQDPNNVLIIHDVDKCQFTELVVKSGAFRPMLGFIPRKMYKYRNLSFADATHSICGEDVYGNAGVLEWCTSEEDADHMLANMREYPQFVNLHISIE
jgi:hypothetical protein